MPAKGWHANGRSDDDKTQYDQTALQLARPTPPGGLVHAWVGQMVTFFAYSPPSRPLGSPTPTQPGKVTNPTRGCPGALWEAPQAVCWLLGREPKPSA